MALPKELTTVTRTSKLLALFLFITLPIIAFFAGTNYQSTLDQANQQTTVQKPISKPITNGWKTLESKDCHLSLQYPPDWQGSKGDPRNCYMFLKASKNANAEIYVYVGFSGYNSWQEALDDGKDAKPTNIPGADAAITNNEVIVFRKGNVIYQLQYDYKPNDNQAKDIISRIISSIKFTGRTSDYSTSKAPKQNTQGPFKGVYLPTQQIPYPASWPSDLQYPDGFRLVYAEVKKNFARGGFRYSGTIKDATERLTQFYRNRGWNVNVTQLDWGSGIEIRNSSSSGIISVGSDTANQGETLIFSQLLSSNMQ